MTNTLNSYISRIFLVLFLISSFTYAQVGIGTSSPAPASLLDITASDRGVLLPRVSIADLNTQAPVTADISSSESLLVYNTNTTTGKGFYYWDSTKWVKINTGNQSDDTSVYANNGTVADDYRTIDLANNIFGYINNTSDNDYLYLSPAGRFSNEFYWASSTGHGFSVGADRAFVIDANRMASITTSNSVPTPTTGSLVINHEQNDGTGVSSIVFPSSTNYGSDYGYLSYADDGSGNGSTGENALLEIGIQNDTPGAYQDDINIASSGNVGISNTAPQEKLHISGNNSTIRVDGLNRTNNATNVQNDPMPVYVDDNGTMILKPSLVQTYMPINRVNFLTGTGNSITSDNNTGNSKDRLLLTETVTLTQKSLVQLIYFYSVSASRRDGSAISDGAPRLFRGWITVNDGAEHYAYDTGTYANAHSSGGGGGGGGTTVYAAGFYYLNGTSYVELPAGTHTLKLYARGFGADFDYKFVFGESDYDRFQVIVHR